MTTYFIDPENGNDSNDGLSFANRWKSFIGTRTTPAVDGDEFRVIASTPKRDLGNGTFVDDQKYFTLANAGVTKSVELCVDAWTAEVGVTEYEAPYFYASGTGLEMSRNFNITTEGKTGKVGYRTLPAVQDLSAWGYMSLLFFLWDTMEAPVEGLMIRLCSDDLGDVVLREFELPRLRAVKSGPVLGDGTPLPANVKSISFFANSPLTAGNGFFFSNIHCCLAPTDPNFIGLMTLVSRQTPGNMEWYVIRGIVDNKIYLGARRYTGAFVDASKFRCVPGTGKVWALDPIECKYVHQYENEIAGSRHITVSGGWSRTDMATQDGVSWISAGFRSMEDVQDPELPDPSFVNFKAPVSFCNPTSNVLYKTDGFGNERVTWKMEKLGFAHFLRHPAFCLVGPILDWQLEGYASVMRGFDRYSWGSQIDMGDATYCEDGPISVPLAENGRVGNQAQNRAQLYGGPMSIRIGKIYGTNQTNRLPRTGVDGNGVLAIEKIHACSFGLSDIRFVALYNAGTMTRVVGAEFRWNYFDLDTEGDVWLEGPSFPDAPPKIYTNQANKVDAQKAVRMDRVNGHTWDTRTYSLQGGRTLEVKIVETPNRHAGKRTVWMERTLGGWPDVYNPLTADRTQVALVPAKAGQLTKVSGYLSNAYGNSKTSLVTLPHTVPGMVRNEAVNLYRNAADQWGRVVLEFTTTVDCLVPIFLEMDFGRAYASEVMLDTSGVPPDGPPVLTLTDTIVVSGVADVLLATYDVVVVGNEDSAAVLNAVGYTGLHMTDGTILSNEGDIIGVVSTGLGQWILAMGDNWAVNGEGNGSEVRVYNEAGDLLVTGDGSGLGMAIPGYPTYGIVSALISYELLPNTTYKIELYRLK